jgi:hypothetical protein
MRRALGLLALIALPRVLLGQGALRPASDGRDLRDVPTTARVEGAPVLPGSIATAPIAIAAPIGVRRGTYTITAMPGVRLFSDSTGELTLQDADSTLLPITYSVSRTRASGLTTIARIVVHWDDHSTWAADFEAEVRARHALRLALASETGLAFRGKSTPLRFMLNNSGNAADTVLLRWSPGGEWLLDNAPLVVVVAPGETIVRTVDLRCPSTAMTGEVHIAQVTATGRGGTLTASAVVRVAYAPATSPGFVEAPTTLFASSTLSDAGSAQQSFAITSTGLVTPETEVSLVARRRAGLLLDPVLAEDLGGQTFRLGMRRNALRAAVGDVWEPGSAMTGLVAQGRGFDLGWSDSVVNATLLVARSSVLGGQNVGHFEANYRTPYGRLGVSAMELRREGSMTGDTSSVLSTGITYSLGTRGEHFVAAELGAIHLQDATGRVVNGLGFDANAEKTIDEDNVSARLHVVPSSPASRSLLPTSAFVGVSHYVNPAVRALASGSVSWLTMETGSLHSAGVSAGAGFTVRDAHFTVLGNLRDLWNGVPAPRYVTGRGATIAVTAPVRAVTLDGYFEHGLTFIRDTISTSDVLRGGVRWNGSQGWLWAGLMYSRSETGSQNRATELSGAYRIGRTELQVGTDALIAPQFSFIPSTGTSDASNQFEVASFWSRVSVLATPDLSVISGMSYQKTSLGSPWRFSLGLRQRLAMPLPVHRPPVAQGVVFEDVNGNRQYDRGEPTVAGVAVTLGFDRVVTQQNGAFAFLDPALRGQPLQLDGATLPIGYLLPPDVKIASQGHVLIPLVRASAVTLRLFIDANADSLRNDAEPLPDGIFVTITDQAGRSLDTTPNRDGQASFPAVLPGQYTVTILLPANGPRAAMARKFTLEVPPGDHVRLDVPLPAQRREIRFNNQIR